jgi:hypothetical protein
MQELQAFLTRDNREMRDAILAFMAADPLYKQNHYLSLAGIRELTSQRETASREAAGELQSSAYPAACILSWLARRSSQCPGALLRSSFCRHGQVCLARFLLHL